MSCTSCGSTPTFNWNTYPNTSCDPCDNEIICKYNFPARCTMYNGPALTCLGLGSNVNIDLVIASMHSVLCTLMGTNLCNPPSALRIVLETN